MATTTSRWKRATTIGVVVSATLIMAAADHPAEPGALAATGSRTSAAHLAEPTGLHLDATAPSREVRGLVPVLSGGHAVPLDGGQGVSTIGILVVDGGAHQCSASVVVSDSHRLLATAAHCVWLRGQWTLEGAYFVPGYHDGIEPWGRWTVESAWVPEAWQQANSPIEDVASEHDVAFVRLAPNRSGQLAEDVLGSQGIWFGAPATPTVTALGYPVTGVFDGEHLERCTGPAHVEQEGSPGGSGRRRPTDSEVLVIDCDMTGGASGGPWLVGPRSTAGQGQVIGVVSGGSGPELVSARYGAGAEQVYHDADTNSGLATGDAQ